jgi:hypothetical protein
MGDEDQASPVDQGAGKKEQNRHQQLKRDVHASL